MLLVKRRLISCDEFTKGRRPNICLNDLNDMFQMNIEDKFVTEIEKKTQTHILHPLKLNSY